MSAHNIHMRNDSERTIFLPPSISLKSQLKALIALQKELGETTSEPYCYRYDLIERDGSSYRIHSDSNLKVFYCIPQKIHPDYYSPKRIAEHQELLKQLKLYFEYQDEINLIQEKMAVESRRANLH